MLSINEWIYHLLVFFFSFFRISDTETENVMMKVDNGVRKGNAAHNSIGQKGRVGFDDAERESVLVSRKKEKENEKETEIEGFGFKIGVLVCLGRPRR